MRILVYYAHPVETSFVAGLNGTVIETLRAAGHDVDACDLNAEGFDPVLSRAEHLGYHDTASNRQPVASHVERLLHAQALVLVYPVWNFGFPAILKGVLDRVFLPGVSFHLGGGSYQPGLRHIQKLAAVCTYGGHRWRAMAMGDPPRKCVKRMLRHLIASQASCEYLAHYDMNNTTPERRAAFISKVRANFRRW